MTSNASTTSLKILLHALLAGYAAYLLTTNPSFPRMNAPSAMSARAVAIPQQAKLAEGDYRVEKDGEGNLSVEFKQANLQDALMEVGKIAHIRIEFGEAAEGLVTLKMKGSPEDILGRLLRDTYTFYYYRSQQGSPRLEAVSIGGDPMDAEAAPRATDF
jgi:type II secretory pathway component GspD/PulD (secretin)